jgi:type 1 fimbriae regulatory protein FimB/type 1 fimbriae regulatory protein FimE
MKKAVEPPRRRPNRELRSREQLTPTEVGRLIAAAGAVGRHQQRDRLLLTLMYRHALRVSEALSLRWDQVDLKTGLLHVNPLKGPEVWGTSTRTLGVHELRLLRQLRRDCPEVPYLFAS